MNNLSHQKTISSLIIGLGFPLTQMTLLLYTPAMSFMGKTLNANPQQMLLTLSILLTGYTVGNLFWGSFSDYIGRYNALLIGLTAYCITSLFIPLAHSYLLFSIFLAIDGFLAGTFTSIGNAMLKDIHGSQHIARVIAFVGIAMATTPAVAPVIGSHLFHYLGWHAIYFFMAGYATIMLAGLIVFVPRPARAPHMQQANFISGIKQHLTNRHFVTYIFSLGLLFGCIMSTLETIPSIYTHYLPLSVLGFGYVSLIFMAPYPLGSIIASKLITRLSTSQIMSFGLAMGLLAAICLTALGALHVKSTLLISLALAGIFLSFGLSLSMAKAGAMTSVNYQLGSASSLMKFTQSFGAMIITAINAGIHQDHAFFNYSLLLTLTLASSLLILRAGLAPKGKQEPNAFTGDQQQCS